jgi:hypothetical protein
VQNEDDTFIFISQASGIDSVGISTLLQITHRKSDLTAVVLWFFAVNEEDHQELVN